MGTAPVVPVLAHISTQREDSKPLAQGESSKQPSSPPPAPITTSSPPRSPNRPEHAHRPAAQPPAQAPTNRSVPSAPVPAPRRITR
ncbi:hypothetical protein FRC12_001388 [Ceratobasidium sp. 428]|nr:hypothetical protein FRC12_001388 [Ceratobasidium sp. 428]